MKIKSFATPAVSLLLALFGLAGGLAGGCNRGGAAAAGGGGQMPPAVVTTAPVTVEDVPVYLDEIGRTTAAEVVTIQPQVSGKIIHRSFEDGADLKAKQTLFEIDPRPYQASLAAANAAVQQSQAQLANAQSDFNRVASLLPGKSVSQQDYDNAKNAVTVADANLKAAQANVETAQLNLEYCTITSPIDGRAGERLVDAGNVVTANNSSLLIIQKITPIYVDFTVAENELDRVRANMAKGPLKVSVQTPMDTEKSVEGTLTFLDNTVQDGTGTIKLRATVPNEARELWPGQFVHVRLILNIMKDAMLIPSEAIQLGQQGQYVYTVKTDPMTKQSLPAPQPISTGQRQGDMVVIEKGISPDQTIIRSGQMMVIPGLPVMIAPAPGSAGAAGAGGHP